MVIINYMFLQIHIEAKNDAIVENRKLMLASYSEIYTVFKQRNKKSFYWDIKWGRLARSHTVIPRVG